MTIHTDQEHQEALDRISELMEIQPEVTADSPEGQELNTLVEAVVNYENIHYPI
jgi:antitoxin component HigA of HigAB toxin-antitoxin module